MIYLDNSATSFYKPASVIGAVTSTLKYVSANPGRSSHAFGLKASSLVTAARTNVAQFFGQSIYDNCVFTGSCTESLNLAIWGTHRNGHIVTTALEHNSVLRPLHAMRQRLGNPISIVTPDRNGVITADSILQKIRPDTYFVAVTHISNVLGTRNPIAEIGELCKKRGLLFLADCAQSAGFESIDMQRDSISLLAVAGHKGLHGPQGVGVCLFADGVDISPIKYGGTGVDSLNLNQAAIAPESFEAGTLPTPNIAGLNAAVKFTQANMAQNSNKIRALTQYLHQRLSAIQNVVMYTPSCADAGVIALNLKNKSSVEVASTLSKRYGIAVRGGLHCAPLAHEFLGTVGQGAVRASISFDNTTQELDAFADALTEIAAKLP